MWITPCYPVGMSRENTYLSLGALIRDARTEKGITLEDLSALSGIGLSRSALSKIEKGEQRLYVHQLLQLASALGLSVNKLLSSLMDSRSSNEQNLPPFIRNI